MKSVRGKLRLKFWDSWFVTATGIVRRMESSWSWHFREDFQHKSGVYLCGNVSSFVIPIFVRLIPVEWGSRSLVMGKFVPEVFDGLRWGHFKFFHINPMTHFAHMLGYQRPLNNKSTLIMNIMYMDRAWTWKMVRKTVLSCWQTLDKVINDLCSHEIGHTECAKCDFFFFEDEHKKHSGSMFRDAQLISKSHESKAGF